MFKKRKYIGPLFEKKPNTINDDRFQEKEPDNNKDVSRPNVLSLKIKYNNEIIKSVLTRSRDNKALDYRDMVNQEMDPENPIEAASRPKKKGSNATVVVFIILLVIVGNFFPSAFRGVQFFFVATILFFISFFIAAKFEK